MFGLAKATKDPLVDERSTERWLASLPPNDPLAAYGIVLVELGKLAERGARRTPARLAALFYLDSATAPLRRTLTEQYLEQASRSNRVESQLWQALFDLTQGFLLGYQAFALEAQSVNSTAKWQAMLPELMAREIIHHGLDAKTRLYRYEHWIPAKWNDLHTLFQTACSLQIERQPVPALAKGALTTIEQEYLRVLVLQLMNAASLSPRNLDWIHDQLSEWCAPLRLVVEAPTLTSFYVDLASRTGLKRRTPQPLEGRVLFLDTRPLHATLRQNVVMLEQKVRQNPLSDRTPRRADQLALMSKLAAQVDPEYRPLARRGERATAAGTVDAIVGFARISGFLHERELYPADDPSARDTSFDQSVELATFGRMRNEHSRVLDMARRRLANYAAPGGPWEIRDVSQTGYRLIAPMSIIDSVTLGTLTAIRPQAQPLWILALVRRMKRLTSERAEIGLQVIANNLVGVELSEHKRSDDGYSVDGVVPTVSGRRFHGLFLSLNKRESGKPIQTLIVPAGEYQPGKRVQMSTLNHSYPVAFGRLLERNSEWIWVTVDSLNHAAPAAVDAAS